MRAQSTKRLMRRVTRQMRGMRTVESGLTPLDGAFGIGKPVQLLAFAIGRDDFNESERHRRRARGKRQRAARRAGR